jgi:hypothetical protein
MWRIYSNLDPQESGEQRKKTSFFKNSLFVRTIRDWNDLPPDILNLNEYEAFKTRFIALRDV